MAVEYLACGDLMSDLVELADGTVSEKNIGGAAMYALSRIVSWFVKLEQIIRILMESGWRIME